LIITNNEEVESLRINLFSKLDNEGFNNLISNWKNLNVRKKKKKKNKKKKKKKKYIYIYIYIYTNFFIMKILINNKENEILLML